MKHTMHGTLSLQQCSRIVGIYEFADETKDSSLTMAQDGNNWQNCGADERVQQRKQVKVETGVRLEENKEREEIRTDPQETSESPEVEVQEKETNEAPNNDTEQSCCPELVPPDDEESLVEEGMDNESEDKEEEEKKIF
jgi:hypothetical protein